MEEYRSQFKACSLHLNIVLIEFTCHMAQFQFVLHRAESVHFGQLSPLSVYNEAFTIFVSIIL